MADGYGGARTGAGRKPGAINKLARDAREAAKLTGMLPHEILLSQARGEPQRVYSVDPQGVISFRLQCPTMEQQTDAAKAAAPYYAPKISTVEVITGVGDDELDAIIAGAAAEAGVGISVDGEGEEEEAPRPQRERRAPSIRT